MKTQRQITRERQKELKKQLDNNWKTWKPDKASGYVRQKPKTKSWKIKALKELNKPIKLKDKDYWMKKIFEDCEFKIISYQDKANKFWATKKRGV